MVSHFIIINPLLRTLLLSAELDYVANDINILCLNRLTAI